MIKARDIVFEVPCAKEQTKAIVNHVSVDISQGQVCGIVGKNGAGKSTLIKILSGFVEPSRGAVFIDGHHLKDYSSQDLAKVRSVLSQEIPVSFGLSVIDILLMGRYPHGRISSEDYKIVDRVIDSLDLRPLLETSYPSLSGGERQKVQFGRALCQLLPLEKNDRKILFLDEPLAALDLSVQQLILSRITDLVRDFGLTVVLVLHDLNYISRYCDYVYLLEKGKLALKGPPQEIFTQANLKHYFDVSAEVLMKENTKPVMIFN